MSGVHTDAYGNTLDAGSTLYENQFTDAFGTHWFTETATNGTLFIHGQNTGTGENWRYDLAGNTEYSNGNSQFWGSYADTKNPGSFFEYYENADGDWSETEGDYQIMNYNNHDGTYDYYYWYPDGEEGWAENVDWETNTFEDSWLWKQDTHTWTYYVRNTSQEFGSDGYKAWLITSAGNTIIYTKATDQWTFIDENENKFYLYPEWSWGNDKITEEYPEG